MLHPFFDAAKYPFHRPDARELHRTLFYSYGDYGRIVTLYDKCHASLPRLAPGAADSIWDEALRNLTSHGVLRPLCDLLCEEFTVGPLRVAIDAVLLAQEEPLEVAVVTQQESPESLPVPKDILILDRQTLRAHLAELVCDRNYLKVLLITGEVGSGKSHSQHLFLYQATVRKEEAVYIRAGMVATLEEAVQLLYNGLGISTGYPNQASGFTTDEAWYRKVCLNLQEKATELNKRLWIAVDDLGLDPDGVPLLDQRIRDFFNHFVLHMDNPAFRQNFRLMLINYPEGPTPTRWNAYAWRVDRLTATGITEEHVEEALQRWSHKQHKTLFEQQVKQLAASVMAEAATRQAAQRVSCIAEKLQTIMATL